jgi:rhodanese-related sulfurtransferase
MSLNQPKSLSPDELRVALSDGQELAMIDVREAKFYAQGHINLATHISLSSLEPQILRSTSRKSVPIVVVDDEGAVKGEAERARDVLEALFFTNVRLLAGGISAWKDSGYALGTGYNTLVKTFSDLALARYDTPTITPGELRVRLASGLATTIIDCRPQQEHRDMTIVGAQNVPGVELALYDLEKTSDAEHLYVISCFSRTRGIVGTTTLALLNNLQNVAFLEDGIMAAFLLGLPTGPGDRQLPSPGQLASEEALRQHAADIIHRYKLNVIDHPKYLSFLAEQDDRTLYIFDVRPEGAYQDGHLLGSQSAPGGQLMMTYDTQVPVRNARVVLIDDAHMKRAAVSAFWISHFNNAEIYILPIDGPDFTLVSEIPPIVLPGDVNWLTPHEAEARLNGGLQILDVGPSLSYERGHIPGAKFVLRSLLPTWLKTNHAGAPLVFTSPDGVNAAYAASEVSRTFGIDAYAISGGTDAWHHAGLPVEVGFDPDQLLSPFLDDWGSTMRAKSNREQIFRDYLTWERSLGHTIPQDDTVQFRWPDTGHNPFTPNGV